MRRVIETLFLSRARSIANRGFAARRELCCGRRCERRLRQGDAAFDRHPLYDQLGVKSSLGSEGVGTDRFCVKRRARQRKAARVAARVLLAPLHS